MSDGKSNNDNPLDLSRVTELSLKPSMYNSEGENIQLMINGSKLIVEIIGLYKITTYVYLESIDPEGGLTYKVEASIYTSDNELALSWEGSSTIQELQMDDLNTFIVTSSINNSLDELEIETIDINSELTNLTGFISLLFLLKDNNILIGTKGADPTLIQTIAYDEDELGIDNTYLFWLINLFKSIVDLGQQVTVLSYDNSTDDTPVLLIGRNSFVILDDISSLGQVAVKIALGEVEQRVFLLGHLLHGIHKHSQPPKMVFNLMSEN